MSSLFERLFDRIGISPSDKVMLLEDEHITTISDLVTRGHTAGSPDSNLRLSLAVAYLKDNTKRLGTPPKTTLESILNENKWSTHSWEIFLLKRFDQNIFDDGMQLSETTALDTLPADQREPTKHSVSFAATPEVLMELEHKVAGTNWKCNAVTEMVDLFLPPCEDDLIIFSDDEAAEGQKAATQEATISVPMSVFYDLFLHQMDGIERIISNFMSKDLKGLLLGDEMGLGKTRQALVAMFSLITRGHFTRACVLVPPSILDVWRKETDLIKVGYEKVLSDFDVVVYSSKGDKKERDKRLRETRKKGKPFLVIASNCLIRDRSKNPLFPTGRDKGFFWDIVMIDEAHAKAKSKSTLLGSALRSKTSKLLKNSFVLLLTATPIQNQLAEFCSLLGLVSKGPDFDNFLKAHKREIEEGQRKNAGRNDRANAGRLIEQLQDLASRYILQRSVDEHFKDQLPCKVEYVVWIEPSKAQWRATNRIINADDAQKAKNSGNRFCIFKFIQRLRMTAIHPSFANQVTDEDVQQSLQHRPNTNEDDEDDDLLVDADDKDDADKDQDIHHDPLSIMRDSPIIRVCCKDLLVPLIRDRHKVLVFCPYRKPFDFLGSVLEYLRIAFYRFDGKTKEKDRSRAIESFNGPDLGVQVMLLTIGAGGLGLTLTGADTVILLGASWNPMVDAQAVGRAFRIGQKKPVTVYRLLMSGLIDEKVYGKQVNKGALIQDVQTITGGCLSRLFDNKELSMLLTVSKNQKECEILRRFPERLTHVPLLTGHVKVHGCIIHDATGRKYSNRFAGKIDDKHVAVDKKRPADATEDPESKKKPRVEGDAANSEQALPLVDATSLIRAGSNDAMEDDVGVMV